jgi:hypothetical protein
MYAAAEVSNGCFLEERVDEREVHEVVEVDEKQTEGPERTKTGTETVGYSAEQH